MTSATDNRTTELRKLLDERGIKWKDGDAAYEIEWSTPDGRHCSAMYWKPTFSVLISGCTPEQAIAATHGGGRVNEDSIDRWLRKFQREHKELVYIGVDELRDLAYALHDDIPLGYEASMRLADWLRVAEITLERDYVSLEAYEDLRDEFVWMSTFLHRMGKHCGTKDVPSLVAYVEQLEAKVAELTCNDALAPENDVTPESVDANDSREKLEADVIAYCNDFLCTYKQFNKLKIMGFIDRQAAITEREREQHWLEIVGASANCNLELTNRIAELQARVDELTAERHALYTALDLNTKGLKDENDGLHRKMANLSAENGALRTAMRQIAHAAVLRVPDLRLCELKDTSMETDS